MNNSNKQRADIETPVYGSQKMNVSSYGKDSDATHRS